MEQCGMPKNLEKASVAQQSKKVKAALRMESRVQIVFILQTMQGTWLYLVKTETREVFLNRERKNQNRYSGCDGGEECVEGQG